MDTTIPLVIPNIIKFDDEWNIDVKQIKNLTIIKGCCAGSGKSYLS